ncbi:DNA cytosine methyltransferase [Rhizobium leguminosarum]|uniref:DNA cytosine methyltransferase n=1 Tax=Rhizobium leguminosarum TaxID=384 RepID=UPI003F9BFF95
MSIALSMRGLTVAAAAKQINVGSQTLQNHLAGEHVRSDSVRKYENWLAGRTEDRNVFALPTRPNEDSFEDETPLTMVPDHPRLVVDIFSGCGGLSLGFDLLDSGRQFRTILAIDNQAAPIAVLNRNASRLGHVGQPVGRRVDLTEFMNEAEFLAFYLQHVATVLSDKTLLKSLQLADGGAFPTFLAGVSAADRRFLEELGEIRTRVSWRSAYESLDRHALNQTSVASFHEKLRLPRPSLKAPTLPTNLWAGSEDSAAGVYDLEDRSAEFIRQASSEWDREVQALSDKREASGRGQLTASARRVSGFVAFLSSDGMSAVQKAWTRWRARRLALRSGLFEDEQFFKALQKLYTEQYRVSVLVGGPPCQGFSRIGRGKIRSLRDARVQVHSDAEAGDARNLLFLQYVMVLGALRPDVFLFENVQHFQSTVKADGVEFEATQVLAEAIASMSNGQTNYKVSSRVLDASRYGIPQTRQRYFMAGVLAASDVEAIVRDAESCLSLRRLPEAALSLALAGLSDPAMVGGDTTGGAAMANLAPVVEGTGDAHPFVRWIRQPHIGSEEPPRFVDGHAARAARSDDAAFFALMGPGKRWMDYRADEAETTREIRAVLEALLALPPAVLDAAASELRKAGKQMPNRDTLIDISSRVDGSLPLRLLLEQAGKRLGAPHHLLADGYLSKRDGHHGDWVARMDSSRPAKTMVSHMGKDTYAYVHPAAPRTISVRESARIQSFPDWFTLADAPLTDAFKMIGNAVPPMLSHAIARQVAHVLNASAAAESGRTKRHGAN